MLLSLTNCVRLASLYTHLIDEDGHVDVDKTHAIGEETSGSDCVE